MHINSDKFYQALLKDISRVLLDKTLTVVVSYHIHQRESVPLVYIDAVTNDGVDSFQVVRETVAEISSPITYLDAGNLGGVLRAVDDWVYLAFRQTCDEENFGSVDALYLENKVGRKGSPPRPRRHTYPPEYFSFWAIDLTLNPRKTQFQEIPFTDDTPY